MASTVYETDNWRLLRSPNSPVSRSSNAFFRPRREPVRRPGGSKNQDFNVVSTSA